MLALPKIIRLRDSRYLKLLEKSIRDNLEAVDGFLISSLEHVGLLQQWDFYSQKEVRRSWSVSLELPQYRILDGLSGRILPTVRTELCGAEAAREWDSSC